MFKTEPGEAGLEVVPDLATDLGKSSDGGKTWTYTLQDGLKFEDGSPITSKDVAYAVLRSMDKTTFTTAPEYFRTMLDITMCNKDEGITKNCYDGPYRTPNFDTSSAVETPDDQTIVFHLKEPFAGMDYMAQLPQTVPVPKAKDTGTKYTKHLISSGPYMFDGEFDPATGFKLVRNPNWDPATDPNRKALPDEMTVKLGHAARRPGQPGSSPTTSTSTSRPWACGPPRSPRCCRTSRSRRRRTTRPSLGSGTPRSTRR